MRAPPTRRGIDERGLRRVPDSEIEHVVPSRRALGLDVLVHGEPERNDMVEYFGEQL